MEPSKFDELTKALATSTSRRQALKAIAATTIGSILGLAGIGTAFAKCHNAGHNCEENSTCCSHLCCIAAGQTEGVCCDTGKVCQNGKCVTPCTSNGGTCSVGTDCCSGNCSNGVCCGSGQVGLCNGTCATPCSDLGGSCSGSCGSGLCGPHIGGPGGPLCSSDTGNFTLCFTDCDCPKGSYCGIPNTHCVNVC